MTTGPVFVPTPAGFRAWLVQHHATGPELLVGFFKAGSGRRSMTWPESVDEALCVGWIDGVRRRIDEHAYSIRFTPRRPRSIWSAVNVDRADALARQGRMLPAGLAAIAARSPNRTGVYSFEQAGEPALDPTDEAAFRAEPEAWASFTTRPGSYRRAAIWWVISAKRPETRARRFALLLAASRSGTMLPHLTRTP